MPKVQGFVKSMSKLRQTHVTTLTIFASTTYHLRAAKRTAELRKSDALNNIFFIPEKSNAAKPFFKFLREAIQETKSFRREDNRNQSHLSDYKSKMLRSQNYLSRKYNAVNVSKEKKQILIDVAFKRTCKNVKQKNGNRIELSHL